MSQSTNDVYPTALKVAGYFGIFGSSMRWPCCAARSRPRREEFRDVLKMGRTQLQDAVPMTLGQEFSTYAVMLGEDEERLQGSGDADPRDQPRRDGDRHRHQRASRVRGARVPPACRRSPAFRSSPSPNLIEATQDCGAFVQLSGVLKRVAVKLSKTCNDLRLLSSGPRAGLGEINLPPMQAGSSIMPGKVNPVIPEVVNQIAFEVIGNDVTVSFAAEAGQLQLNAFEPIIAHSLFKSVDAPAQRLPDAGRALRQWHHRESRAAARHRRELDRRRDGAQSVHRLRERDRRSRRRRLRPGAASTSSCCEKKLLSKERLDEILQPEVLTRPRPILESREIATRADPARLAEERTMRC